MGFWHVIDDLVKIAAQVSGALEKLREGRATDSKIRRERVAIEKQERYQQAGRAANARWSKVKKPTRKAA